MSEKGARWTKGGPSPNPGGQTRAHVAMRRMAADMIASETDGGREIIEFVLGIVRADVSEEANGPVPADARSKCWAAGFLADRLWGKAPLVVEAAPPPVDLPDMTGLSIAELRAMAAGDDGGQPPGDVH